MKKTPVIIDCDPGIDDAVAIGYALADPLLDVRLITTVSGNVHVDRNTKNAQHIIALCEKEIPLAKGEAKPLMTEAKFAEHVHGVDGMGGYQFKSDLAPLLDSSAIEAMVNELKNSKEKIVLIPIGPLTNIAKMLMLYPEVKEKIAYISLMGGGLKGGNATVAAEFNFYFDPEAAHYLFEQGIEIIMAGLDVTEKTVIQDEALNKLAATSSVGSVLAEILRLSKVKGYYKERSLHDLVSVMAVSHLDLFAYEKFDVMVETGGNYSRGMTIADDRQMGKVKGNTKVLLDVKQEEFFEQLFKVVRNYQSK